MRIRLVLAPIAAALAGAAMLPIAATAQTNVEGRVGQLESEMRAVQRKVFPGGSGHDPARHRRADPVGRRTGQPASSAVVDLTQRVSSLEQQMATLTGQVEQNGYQLRTAARAVRGVQARDRRSPRRRRDGRAPAPIAGSREADEIEDRPATTRPATPPRTATTTLPPADADRRDHAAPDRCRARPRRRSTGRRPAMRRRTRTSTATACGRRSAIPRRRRR